MPAASTPSANAIQRRRSADNCDALVCPKLESALRMQRLDNLVICTEEGIVEEEFRAGDW